MDLNILKEILISMGLPTALVVFFIWTGHKREAGLVKRIEALESQVSELNRALLKQATDLITSFVEAVKTRPCLLSRDELFKRGNS